MYVCSRYWSIASACGGLDFRVCMTSPSRLLAMRRHYALLRALANLYDIDWPMLGAWCLL
jgi:hypothetical protein